MRLAAEHQRRADPFNCEATSKTKPAHRTGGHQGAGRAQRRVPPDPDHGFALAAPAADLQQPAQVDHDRQDASLHSDESCRQFVHEHDLIVSALEMRRRHIGNRVMRLRLRRAGISCSKARGAPRRRPTMNAAA
ncbi:MAG: hypothetical protein IPO58_05885 [Betaproteobacteria bacterium]|nr:hypothetical protein [Betaproteobacteria bacterium]